MKYEESRTPFAGRISVNGTGANGEVVLTINDVRLEDEVEFICLVRSLTEGSGEGRTNLKVFGKASFPQTVVSSLQDALKTTSELLPLIPEIPDLPTIEGVQTGISVNQDSPSKVSEHLVR